MGKTEEVYQTLLINILKGELRLGQRLIENDLINKYHVSKTPLREALFRLEKNNLVTRTPNRGFEVISLKKNDIEEIFDLREVLEGLSVQKICNNLTEENKLKLSQLIEIDKMRFYASTNNIKEYRKLDTHFHLSLCEMSQNQRLLDIIKNIHYQIRILLHSTIYFYDKKRIEISYTEHKKIYDTILLKKTDTAVKLIKEHIVNIKKAILMQL